MDEPERSMMDEYGWGRIIASFVLTLIGIPVLFVATCVPVGLLTKNGNMYLPDYLPVAAYTLLFAAASVGIAIRAKNAGTRWGIVIALIVSALWVSYVLFGLRLQ